MSGKHRLLGEYDQAVEAYDRAIAAGERFAPAYVGRARVLLLVNPAANVDKDLQQAAEIDPQLVETFIVRAGYLLAKGDAENALQDLETAARSTLIWR
jgi:tetratricopeptide (TPR) repeat protein